MLGSVRIALIDNHISKKKKKKEPNASPLCLKNVFTKKEGEEYAT